MNRGDWPGVDRVGAWSGARSRILSQEQPRRQTEREVEVVALAGKRVVLAGEAKWSLEPVGFGVLEHLRRVIAHVPGADAATD